MKSQIALCLLAMAALCLVTPRSFAQTSKGEFLFGLSSATKGHSLPGIQECFNFDRTDPEMARAIMHTIEEIANWSSPHVFTSERASREPLKIKKNGKTYVLNGEWMFQVHIHRSPPPSKGYVFPAGLDANGKYRILLTVPEKT